MSNPSDGVFDALRWRTIRRAVWTTGLLAALIASTIGATVTAPGTVAATQAPPAPLASSLHIAKGGADVAILPTPDPVPSSGTGPGTPAPALPNLASGIGSRPSTTLSLPAINVTPQYPGEAFGALSADTADNATVLYTGECCQTLGPASYTWLIGNQTLEADSSLVTRPPLIGFYSDQPMVDDPHDGYVLLWGGTNLSGNVTNQTWAYQHGVWTQLHPAVSPPVNINDLSPTAYDPAEGAVIRYVSHCVYNATLGCIVVNDTWQFSGGNWSLISNQTPPGFPQELVMAYDAADGYMLGAGWLSVYNSTNQTWHPVFSTWKYANGTWSEVNTSTVPTWSSGNNWPRGAYDPASRQVLVWGGTEDVNGTSVPVAWAYSGGDWTPRPSYQLPSAGAALSFTVSQDPATGSLVAYVPGGLAVGNNSTAEGLVWFLTNGSWESPRSIVRVPTQRCCMQGTFDSGDGHLRV